MAPRVASSTVGEKPRPALVRFNEGLFGACAAEEQRRTAGMRYRWNLTGFHHEG